jgi:vancomycin resistance protein YoaR
MRIDTSGKRKTILLALIFVAAVAAGMCLGARGAVVAALFDNERICRGVSIDGVSVGDLTVSEARSRLEELVREYEESPISMRCQDAIWRVNPGDLGVRIEFEAALRAAHSLGRSGHFCERIAERASISRSGYNISWTVTVDEQLLRDFVFAMAQQVETAPVDARLVIHDDDRVSIEPDSDGWLLDTVEFINALRKATTSRSPRELEIPVRRMPAKCSTASIEAKGIRRLISAYTTKFDARKTNRVNNIRLGAQKLNNRMLAPGEVMSFNDVVGPRIPERGFMEADIIFDSQLVPGVGGGICQVSTTLYNAALLGLMEPVSRTNHSLPISYVSMGRDAAVSYGSIDLKIKNTTAHYVLIRSYVGSDTVSFKIYGDMPDNMDVSIYTEVVERLEPSTIERVDYLAPPGSARVESDGKPGYVVSVWRIIKVDGVEARRELISRDRYKPQPKVVVLGPTAAPTATEPEPSLPSIVDPPQG